MTQHRWRLSDVTTVVQFGRWMAERGYDVSEGPDPFGPISPTAHTPTSLHYKRQAFDVNVGASGPAEDDALRDLYHCVLRWRRNHPRFPLDEMFYDDLGYLKELGPDVNHAISGHSTHLHIGWSVKRWA